jgi:hypothetical protein
MLVGWLYHRLTDIETRCLSCDIGCTWASMHWLFRLQLKVSWYLSSRSQCFNICDRNIPKRILDLNPHSLIVHIIIQMCGIPSSTLARNDTPNWANCRTHNSCVLSTRTKDNLWIIKICKLFLALCLRSNQNEIESDACQLESLINRSAVVLETQFGTYYIGGWIYHVASRRPHNDSDENRKRIQSTRLCDNANSSAQLMRLIDHGTILINTLFTLLLHTPDTPY